MNNERNILAYFKSPDEANEVLVKLQSLRVIDASVDRISRYGGGGSMNELSNPITGNITGLGGLVLNAAESSNSAGILMAADPSASGMSHGGQGGPTGRDILLTAVVDESVHERAMKIIEDAGGMI